MEPANAEREDERMRKDLSQMNGSTCPTSDDWVRYLLDEKTAGATASDDHLQHCPNCRFVVAHLLNELSAVAESYRAVGTARVVHLRHWQDPREAGDMSLRLAAKAEAESRPPVAVTLASDDQQLILKAVRDVRTGEIWLFLVHEDPAMYRNVLVRPFGLEREFLTDPEGRINLGKAEWPAPDMYTAEVRLPLALFTLTPLQWREEEKSATLTAANGDQIRVVLTESERTKRVEIEILNLTGLTGDTPIRVAVREGSSADIVLLSTSRPQRAAVENVKAVEPIEIFLFQ
ncbi:MAG: hypothetical protein AB1644_07430 [Candidatus Zixiibacteriota bacterium]